MSFGEQTKGGGIMCVAQKNINYELKSTISYTFHPTELHHRKLTLHEIILQKECICMYVLFMVRPEKIQPLVILIKIKILRYQ